MDLIEVLGFLFMLSTMELGRVGTTLRAIYYSLTGWTGLFDRESRRDAEGDVGRSPRLRTNLAAQGMTNGSSDQRDTYGLESLLAFLSAVLSDSAGHYSNIFAARAARIDRNRYEGARPGIHHTRN